MENEISFSFHILFFVVYLFNGSLETSGDEDIVWFFILNVLHGGITNQVVPAMAS